MDSIQNKDHSQSQLFENFREMNNASTITQPSTGQQFLINLSNRLDYLIDSMKLDERQSDLSRFYFELTIQDEISNSSFDSIEKIHCLAQDDALLKTAIELIDELVGTAISTYEQYDIAELREEYASLLKKKPLSENDDERIGFILRLALTDEIVFQMTQDVDTALLKSNDYGNTNASSERKDYMAKVLEKVGREDSIQIVGDRKSIKQPLPELIGREEDIRKILGLLEKDNKIVFIQGVGGMGKTSLCHYLLRENFEQYIEFPIASEIPDLAAVEALIEGQLSVLGETPAQNFQGSWIKLQRQLKTRRIGVLVDNLETIINDDGTFLNSHKEYGKLLRFLSSPQSQSITFITSRKNLKNPDFQFAEYELEGLSKEHWYDFFQKSGIEVHIDDLQWLHQAHSGNPKAMEILRGKMTEQRDFSILNYCLKLRNASDLDRCSMTSSESRKAEASQNLTKLISEEFNDLMKSDNDGFAYKLLVRLGCYRYQETAAPLSVDALKYLLWDVPEQKKEVVIQTLLKRSLVNVNPHQGYVLHPSIRKEALTRLLSSNDWILANTLAASYWTNKVETIETPSLALQALEAYYHYMSIEDYQAAANILINRRKNAFGTNESLARSLYKLGLLMHVEEAIKGVKKKDITAYQRIKLIHTLAAIAWLQGNIDKSIKRCTKVHTLVEDVLVHLSPDEIKRRKDVDFRIVNLNAYLTNALCYLGHWRLGDSLQSLYKVIELASYIDPEKFEPCASFYIAYIHSLPEPECDSDIALLTSERLFERWNKDKMPSWLTEYRLYYLGLAFTNLGQTCKALSIHTTVLNNQFHSRYEQAKTKHLNGLACCYREMGEFDMALLNHGKAITSFQSIGARTDLAEAYFQQAISYERAGQPESQIQTSLKYALAIYEDMNAVLQKKRILQWKHQHNLTGTIMC
jgi:tetratricopeptide (TPR) repeat protein